MSQDREDKEKVKKRLLELIEISQDAYYDQYLGQMLKDLDSGKATPEQVMKEADRTYQLYRERMSRGQIVPKQRADSKLEKAMPARRADLAAPAVLKQKKENAVEFKIGAGILSIVGAVFILTALVILGFNFFKGVWQGICLYAVALAVILVSELLIRRVNRTISLVITGIGTASLYIATIINYAVLKNINGLAAAIITAVIALLAIFVSRKKDAAFLRMICIFGCYISFIPADGYESGLSFLVIVIMLFIINTVSIFFPNQKNRAAIGMVHMAVHTLFTYFILLIAAPLKVEILYQAFFLISSLVVLNMIYLRQREEKLPLYFTICFEIYLGFFALFTTGLGTPNYAVSNDGLQLFYKLLIEVMALAVAAVCFILWGKDRRRWIQYYFIAAVVVLFNGFSDYKLETTIGVLLIFIVTKFLFRVKELTVLDCILTVITALQGLYMTGSPYVWPFAAVLLLSVFWIRKMAIFHEIVITLFLLLGILFQFNSNWTLTGCVLALFVLFLLFNHLPWLKGEKQFPYNIVNIILAVLLYLCTWFCYDYFINSVNMVIGTTAIIVMFRERYGLKFPKKYLLAAGFLAYMILTAHFATPVIISILLMILALACVAAGFRLKDKSCRLCGLVVAILVCIKLVLYDFRELDALPKAILFFTVGMIALLISFLYIFLEKREAREAEMQIENSEAELAENVKEEAETEAVTIEISMDKGMKKEE